QVSGDAGESKVLCDACTRLPQAWDRGRAVFRYEGTGRRIVLALKHADRLDMIPPLAEWLKRSAADLLADADLIAPVPLHRLRLLRRRYNQSAELARGLARLTPADAAVDLLVRRRGLRSQHGLDRETRHENVMGAFSLHRRWRENLRGRHVLLVDDVMTTGATLSACAEVCRGAGASKVDVCVLARVAQDT
ncbi:MAG: ComF family protein, partial [Paracoccaceae bacterium]